MSVILKPIITEKMTQMGEKLNRYGFKVDKRANKLQIKQAIKDIYGVEVADINTMVYRGKAKPGIQKVVLSTANPKL
jgi:large subunit ribosomal protein L23